MSNVVTLHSLAASFARLEETLAAERAADKKETINYFDLCIAEIRLIKDMLNKYDSPSLHHAPRFFFNNHLFFAAED
jgi:hypothetical protein